MESVKNLLSQFYFFSSRFAIFLIFISLILTAQTAYAQKVATLEGVNGEVKVYLPGKTRGLKGRNGMALFGKTEIRTPNRDSYASIIYNNNAKVRVMPLSKLVLASADTSNGKIRVKMDLISGKIFNLVNKLHQNEYYEVTTPTSTSGVKGTFFSVFTTEILSIWIVKDGDVEITSLSGFQKSVSVGTPKKTIVRKGQPPTDPIPMSPEELEEFDDIFDMDGNDGDDPDTLSDAESDAIDEAAEEARQLTLNVTSPKL